MLPKGVSERQMLSAIPLPVQPNKRHNSPRRHLASKASGLLPAASKTGVFAAAYMDVLAAVLEEDRKPWMRHFERALELK
jgi:hypothetical protein